MQFGCQSNERLQGSSNKTFNLVLIQNGKLNTLNKVSDPMEHFQCTPPSQCALYSVSYATSLTSWPWNLYISGGRGGGYFYSLLCLTSCIKAIQLFPHPATIWLGSLSLALMEYRILRKTRLFHI